MRATHITATLLCLTSMQTYAALEAVIVSGARTEQSSLSTPANITVITKQQIEASGAEHVVDVLRGQGAIFVQDSFGDGSRATVSMRGFSGSTANANTLVMVDGRRLNNTDLSSPDFNSVSLKDIERIEIVQGSAGVLFGDQAVGGVINIITTRTSGDDIVVGLNYGSYHSVGARIALNKQVSDQQSFRMTVENKRSDNYRRENNDLEYRNLLMHTRYDYDGGHVSAELQLIDEELGLPGSLTVAELIADRRQTYVDFVDDFTDSRTQVLRLGSKHNLSGAWSFEGEVSVRDVERDIQQSFRGSVATSPSRLERQQLELTPRLVGRLPTVDGELRFTTGIDLVDTDFESTITSSADDQRMLAAYAQVVAPASTDIDITAGARRARVEDDVTSFLVNGKQRNNTDVFELGVVGHIDDESKLFIRYDQSFRFAKVDELTYVSPGTRLRPQTGNSTELGVAGYGEQGRYSVSFYRLSLQDEIAFDPTAPDPFGGNTGANVNFDPTTHQGMIIELSRKLHERVTVNASYSYTDATFDSGVFADKRISGVPENSARLGVTHELSVPASFQLDAVYTGSHFLDGDNANVQARVAGYTVINLNLMLRQKAARYALKINNLTGREYFENANSFGSRFPLPERHIMLTASWDIQ